MTIALALLAATSAAFADLDAIDRQVASFTGAAIGESGGALTPVDRRLRLQPCLAGIALSWRTQNRESVVVQCGDMGGWRLFVPVRQIPVAQEAAAPMAISKGDAVAIAVSGEGFSVSQPGQALEAGAVGQWIAVLPVGSGKGRSDKMQAQVVRPGLVSIPLP